MFYMHVTGKPTLVECSQVPKQHAEAFRKRHTLFNTNNMWINLRSLHRLLVNEELSLDVVTNERTIDR